MIIGICGLIGSGKDTIAEYLIKEHNYIKLSFADKLKDSVATMFDWDRELFIPFLSIFIVWFFTMLIDDTSSIISLSSLDLSVNSPDCNRKEVNK